MNVYKQIASNKQKTWIIMSLFVVFITTLAYVFGVFYDSGVSFALIALAISVGVAAFSYFSAGGAVLSLSGAKKIDKATNPHLFTIVENLCIASGIPMPEIYVIHDSAPNAFATGRDPKHGVICFTTGILEKLNKAELEGVTAHELSHIKNYDIRLMAIVVVLVGFIALLSDIFLRSLFFSNDRKNGHIAFILVGIGLAALSPIAATLIQLAVSRKREFLADASGVLITRYPDALASALEKIAADPKPVAEATNATAHLFIENPFKQKNTGHWFSSLFNTHPPVAERIRILRSM